MNTNQQFQFKQIQTQEKTDKHEKTPVSKKKVGKKSTTFSIIKKEYWYLQRWKKDSNVFSSV